MRLIRYPFVPDISCNPTFPGHVHTDAFISGCLPNWTKIFSHARGRVFNLKALRSRSSNCLTFTGCIYLLVPFSKFRTELVRIIIISWSFLAHYVRTRCVNCESTEELLNSVESFDTQRSVAAVLIVFTFNRGRVGRITQLADRDSFQRKGSG